MIDMENGGLSDDGAVGSLFNHIAATCCLNILNFFESGLLL